MTYERYKLVGRVLIICLILFSAGNAALGAVASNGLAAGNIGAAVGAALMAIVCAIKLERLP